MVVQVTTPHFCAGLVFQGLTCTEAAPILHWAVNKDRDWLRAYFKRKGWKAAVVR